ncbi:hypothetical protein RFI_26320 [Reticulomyxa filosa]|uniref:ABC transporter substrate-binding protein n=1 Tax=Reticulomyxa filosa TaxID=46433 RepID=X6MAL5_RETFI|nr:hypothetical protein RFI_26320 [Reticulomyxa filosa]|eukprot:ETO11053.1 hypothetical protein RFI_26320 [Reticulomyxa filosa]
MSILKFHKIFIHTLIVSCLSVILNCGIAKNIVIGIANYGPHASLEATISGFKKEMSALGYDKQIEYLDLNVNFDQMQIPNMLSRIKASKPDLVIAISTPVAQAAKRVFKENPIIFAAIIDPVEAKLLENYNNAGKNITGSILFSTSEANDKALIEMFKEAGEKEGISTLAVGIDSSREISIKIKAFKNKGESLPKDR